MTGSRAPRLVLAAILLFTVALGARGITDEASVMLTGDMARYVMNAVFLHDLVAAGGAWDSADLVNYAERYFARYPALSLGHHPPLLYIAMVPFFAVFGVSLFAARLAALTFFVLAAWGLYAIAKRVFDWRVASWATLLFVTNVFVLRFGQYALSEMPMLALVLASVNALLVYCETRQPRHLAWFALAAVASLYAKQLAVFVFPVYGIILVTRLGWRTLFRRHVIVMAVVGGVLVVPLVVMTLALAPANVTMAMSVATRLVTGARRVTVPTIITTIVNTHLSFPALMVVIAGAVVLAARRDKRVIVGLAWVLSVFGGAVVFAGGIEPARYAFGAMPAYFLLAAGLAAVAQSRPARWVVVLTLSCVILWQSWLIRNVRPSGAGGYEAAAQYVVDHSQEPTMLFDSSVDTGYFVFFVRKHDPGGRLVVLRADKLLMPPSAGLRAAADPAEDAAKIYAALRRFGIRFVVVEERSRGPRILRQLHDELKTDEFVERQRIPIVSREPRAQDVDLVIYEFKAAQPADLDAELDIGLPLGRREIKLRLRDVVGGGR